MQRTITIWVFTAFMLQCSMLLLSCDPTCAALWCPQDAHGLWSLKQSKGAHVRRGFVVYVMINQETPDKYFPGMSHFGLKGWVCRKLMKQFGSFPVETTEPCCPCSSPFLHSPCELVFHLRPEKCAAQRKRIVKFVVQAAGQRWLRTHWPSRHLVHAPGSDM